MRFAFIHAEKACYPVTVLCRVMAVSRSGYHAWSRRAPSARLLEDRRLASEVEAVFVRSRRTYGSPRIAAEFRASGRPIGAKRVARLMRSRQIAARPRRRFKATTDSRHRQPIAPNLVGRNFEATAPDRVWVSDVKAVPTDRGWLHLAILMDLFSRRIVGFATSVANDTNLALSALRNSLAARRSCPGLVHHTDRGSPYASAEYRQLLEQHGAVASMSRPRDCWDNAVAESFFSTLTAELLKARRFASPEQAAAEIADYIDGFYNLACVADPVSETSDGWYSRSLRQQAASVLCGCSVTESSEDPAFVESLGELA